MLAYAHLETKLFTVRHVTVPILPAPHRDIRILHVSDFHLTPTQGRKIAWIRSLADLDPDFVVNTGDNMAHRDALEPLLEALDPLLSTTAGAFVMGSNDYYAPRPKNPARYLRADAREQGLGLTGLHSQDEPLPAAELATALRAAGWADLTNRRQTVTINGLPVDLVGVDDPHLERDAFPPPTDNPTPGHLRVGVLHAPYTRVLNQMHHDGSHLVIAGHTHGGQLCLPGIGALVTNCDLDRGRAKGLSGWPGPRPDQPHGDGSSWLHVSAGAGTSPYAPVRFACRPEATLLTLTPRTT